LSSQHVIKRKIVKKVNEKIDDKEQWNHLKTARGEKEKLQSVNDKVHEKHLTILTLQSMKH